MAQRTREGGADRGIVLDEQHLRHARDRTARYWASGLQ
jgi:hypothetical protein